ncbi:hypothetical protein A4A49_57336, partial [Nicotiana attenuata]
MMIKTLIWNIRSVRTQQAYQRMINMHKEYGFFIFSLMEPFQKDGHIQRYRIRLGMDAAYSNINGKIWLLFDSVMDWELLIDTEQ